VNKDNINLLVNKFPNKFLNKFNNKNLSNLNNFNKFKFQNIDKLSKNQDKSSKSLVKLS